ncbi:hypothetical protein P7C71_g2954, partial [Lecanoromycetidae sp. Uapishka_2]
MPTSPSASTSYLYPTTSIPTTPSILSRAGSQTRLRPLHSSAQPISTSISSPTLQKDHSKRRKRTIRNTNESEDDWITRTASTLTLTRLEEKGQSWLAARNSSTSLTGGEVGDDEYDPYSPEWQRSRIQSQRHSRTQLQQARSRRGSSGKEGVVQESGEDVIGPDFVDVDDEDNEEEGEEVDEREMKKVVMGRGGGGVDWAVGWMDFKGDGEDEEDREQDGNVQEEESKNRGQLDPVELQKRLRKKKKKDDEIESGIEVESTVASPPEQAGVWNDAKWLLAVAKKAALQ